MFKAIEKRVSVRSYKNKPLTIETKLKVKETIKDIEKKPGPFNHKVKFFFSMNESEEGNRIGTYGFIKNPPAFIGGIVENSLEGMVDFGFLFEEVILHLTKDNIGTCWLGGTYNRNDFDVEVGEGEIIAAVSPVGFSANKSVREKIIRGVTRANKRKPFDELFFISKDLLPIDKNNKYHKYLEAVQAGPSASNKQPWRIVLIDNIFNLYLKRTKGYGNKLKMDIQAIDMGIALSHLFLTLKEDKLSPEFINEKPLDLEDSEYILSIKINK